MFTACQGILSILEMLITDYTFEILDELLAQQSIYLDVFQKQTS